MSRQKLPGEMTMKDKLTVIYKMSKLLLRNPIFPDPWVGAEPPMAPQHPMVPAQRPEIRHPVDEMDDDEVEVEMAMMTEPLVIITLTYDPTSGQIPEMDIGETSPVFAASMLEQAYEAIKMQFPYPRITHHGEVFFDPSYGEWE